jgi:hypothetical protein
MLEAHHFTIVPPGWRLANPQNATPDEQPAGSLGHALVQLAAANGHALIARLGVEANGQTRLL